VGQTAEELEVDLAHTREHMSETLDAIGNRMSPNEVAKRSTQRIGQWIRALSENVMGSAADADEHGVGRSEPGQMGQNPPSGASQPQGSPLAAGLVAFGIGVLVGSLPPPSKAEQQAMSALSEKAAPAIEAAKQAASDVAQGVGESARQAADTVGQAAIDTAQEIKDQTLSSASHGDEAVTSSSTP
jgi:hypothetical protein